MRVIENPRTHQLSFSVGQAIRDDRRARIGADRTPRCRCCDEAAADGWRDLCDAHARQVLAELDDPRRPFATAA